jgi:crotonobetainyl-CoA:carnitine CoA-transferase CaiB-like acyl-CoA transferase
VQVGTSPAASFAAMLLQSVGITVIRAEVGPPTRSESQNRFPHERATYECTLAAWLGRGTYSVTFRDGSALVRNIPALASLATVVVDGLDDVDRAAVGPLAALPCPRVSVTPHGLLPDARAGSDLTAVAASAAMWAIGLPEREPLTIPFDYSSFQAGVVAAMLTLASIMDPAAAPPVIDVAIAEVVGTYAALNAMLFTWERDGHRAVGSGGAYPYTLLPCADGSVCLAARTNADWRRILQALGAPAWSDDPRFADVQVNARDHADELDARLTTTMASMTRAEILARAVEVGAPIAPVRRVEEIAGDDEAVVTGTIREITVGDAGVAMPWLSWLPVATTPAPRSGEHNALVLEALAQQGHRIPSEELWWE